MGGKAKGLRGGGEGERRSPLEGHVALARAGEGIDRKIREGFEWVTFYWAGVAVALVAACVFAWSVELLSPWSGLGALTVATLIGSPYIVWRLWRGRESLRRMKQGMEGEVAVGEVLDGLRERGYRVFHDVGSEGEAGGWGGGNIDHVVIGRSGVYVIETKTRSLPARSPHPPRSPAGRLEGARDPRLRGASASASRGRAVIETDGKEWVRVGDGPRDTRPIRQVCAARRRVREWLEREGMGEKAGWKVPVRAVVMYPGRWWIEGSSGKEVWVLRPEWLVGWIATEEGKVTALEEDRLGKLVGRFEEYARRLAGEERGAG